MPLSMNDWADSLSDATSLTRWVGGHYTASEEASLFFANGLHIRFAEGSDYASAGLLSRMPIVGDFEAQVRFTTSSPNLGTSLELAAISIDGPPRSALVQKDIKPEDAKYLRSRVYNVHGAPPYVSSEFDENDGARIGWNRGPATEMPVWKPSAGSAQPVIELISDNHYNRYGRSTWPARDTAAPVSGWLRIQRRGNDWSTAYRVGLETDWHPSGQVLAMNLPSAVFLRLAAKHWVKRPSTKAHATEVCFSDISVSFLPHFAKVTSADAPVSPVPVEVGLVTQVRGCRACTHFNADSPYGAFVHVQSNGLAPTDGSAHRVTVRAVQRPEPDVLFGCRKAPIMLVGINPNLPQAWLAPKSERAAKPHAATKSWVLRRWLDTDADYAAEHRYAPKPPLRASSAAGLDPLLSPSGALVAEFDGTVAPVNVTPDEWDPQQSWRNPLQRFVRLALNDALGFKRSAELRWSPDQAMLVLRDTFQQGERIAGTVSQADAVGHTLDAQEASTDTFYRQADRLLQALGRVMQEANPAAKVSLRLGEDMSLHDVVACASPGWSRWNIPSSVQNNCVLDGQRRFLHQQVAQSAPAVILVSGSTALGLMCVASEGTLNRPVADLPLLAAGPRGMFAQLTQALWWTPVKPPGRPVRLLLVPHLSYPDNFLAHSGFADLPAWQSFVQRFPQVVSLLQSKGRVHLVEDLGITHDRAEYLLAPPTVVLKQVDVLWDEVRRLSPTAYAELKASWVDPVRMVGHALQQALAEANTGLRSDGALDRAKGSCAYCTNDLWTIGAGCAYHVGA